MYLVGTPLFTISSQKYSVPQGTVLGLLLFLIYINDLPTCISSSCSLFAGDCLLYRKVENDDDRRALQQDLYNIEMCARKWLMSFSVDKCEVYSTNITQASK